MYLMTYRLWKKNGRCGCVTFLSSVHHSWKWSEQRNIESRCGFPVVAVSLALLCVSPRRVYREGCRLPSWSQWVLEAAVAFRRQHVQYPRGDEVVVSCRCVFVRLHESCDIVTCRLPIIARCVGDRFVRRHRPSRASLHSCLLIS